MKIEAQNLSYTYQKGYSLESAAVTNVNFTVNSGEFVCLIGHTGSGKSTLLQLLSGLLKPGEGKVLAEGIDINSKTPEAKSLRKRIGIIFQYPEYQLFEETVLKDVCFGPLNQGNSPEEAKLQAEKALEMVGIEKDKWNESPFALSGGQKRRVAIAGILAMQPELLILDEPTAGLDPKAHEDILDLITNIKKNCGTTIILVTHNMDDAANLANRIFVMNGGKLVMEGSSVEVFSKADTLKKMGLGLPSSCRLLSSLKEQGLNVNTNIFTMRQAAEEIAKAINGN